MTSTRAPAVQVTIEKALPVPVTARWLRSVLVRAAALPAVAARLPDGAALTLRLTGDRELRRLHGRFMGEDSATDVLSFPAGEDGPEPGYLGDLALSWPAARRQAEEFGHEPALEVALLSVHGLLHLLGWDHADREEAAEMTAVTLAALDASGLRPAPGRL